MFKRHNYDSDLVDLILPQKLVFFLDSIASYGHKVYESCTGKGIIVGVLSCIKWYTLFQHLLFFMLHLAW